MDIWAKIGKTERVIKIHSQVIDKVWAVKTTSVLVRVPNGWF